MINEQWAIMKRSRPLMIILSPLLFCKSPLPVLIILPNVLNQLRTVCIFWVIVVENGSDDNLSPFQASNMSWMKKS